MYTHILVPTDGSPLSVYAIDEALKLARAVDARVTFFTAVDALPASVYAPEMVAAVHESYHRQSSEEADRRLAVATGKAAAAGVACDTVKVEKGYAEEGIIEVAGERGCDLIAMASHGRRGMKALVLGSVTAKVLTHSEIPVLVYRHKAD